MIHVEHLHKKFGSVHAVNDVSFSAARGEVVGLLGPNGAGKTTTMRIITGFLDADEGLVSVDGVPVSRLSIGTRIKVGYLPENTPVYADLETTEYLEYIARLKCIPRGQVRVRLGEMIETCGLSDAVGRQIGKLSKGFKQRVGLAAAMINKPEVLILDEPTSGLDPNQIADIRTLIRNLGKERAVILSTHIMQEVEATCGRALIISDGRLVGHGTIEELRKKSGAHVSYTMCLRETRDVIEDGIKKLEDMFIGEWLSEEGSERQRFTIRSERSSDRSEDIFNWAVARGFVLSELTHETASLEEVFRKLTQN